MPIAVYCSLEYQNLKHVSSLLLCCLRRLESFTRRRSELSLGGDDFETLRHHLGDGCSQISSYTMAHNAHVKLQTAIIQCLEACSSAVSSMMGKRWGLLTTVCDSSGRFTSPQLVVQLASIVINVSTVLELW